MAASDARPVPRKNTAYRVTFPIFDNTGALVTGAAGLDSEVSIDAGTFADCTSEAVEIATASGMYYLDLTAGEMNGDTIAVIVKTSTTDAKTTPIVMYPEEVGDFRVDVVQISGDTTAADNAEAFFDGTGYAGTNNVIPTVTSVAGLAANSITASALATSAAEEIADTVWDEARAGHVTAGTFGEGVVTNSISTTERAAVADAFLDRNMATGTDSGSDSVRTPCNALRILRNKVDVTTTTLTVTKEDDSTTAWSAAITTNSNAQPIVGVNPG